MTKVSEIPRDHNGVRCEPGIVYTRYKWLPVCPFCGLEDPGKKAGGERPDPRHMINCKSRPLPMLPCERMQTGLDEAGKPKYENCVKPGSFIGQAYTHDLKIPIRVMGKFQPKFPDGSPDGDEKNFCYYRWSFVNVISWVFTKDGWKPWFQVLKTEQSPPHTGPIWKNLHWKQPNE